MASKNSDYDILASLFKSMRLIIAKIKLSFGMKLNLLMKPLRDFLSIC